MAILEKVNQAIGELLTKLNHRHFRKRDSSRASVFASLEIVAKTEVIGPDVTWNR